MAFHLGYVADSDEEGRRTWGQDFVSQFFDQAVPWSSQKFLFSPLNMNMWGHALDDRQASPPPRSGPVMRLRRWVATLAGDSGTALQHRLWKSNASLRPKMSIWKAQGRERPGALGSFMYDDGWFWRDESVFLFPPPHGCIHLSWGRVRVQQQKWCVGNLWRQGPPKRRQTLLGTQLVVDDFSQMFSSLAFSQIFESFLEPAMKDLVPSCRHYGLISGWPSPQRCRGVWPQRFRSPQWLQKLQRLRPWLRLLRILRLKGAMGPASPSRPRDSWDTPCGLAIAKLEILYPSATGKIRAWPVRFPCFSCEMELWQCIDEWRRNRALSTVQTVPHDSPWPFSEAGPVAWLLDSGRG